MAAPAARKTGDGLVGMSGIAICAVMAVAAAILLRLSGTRGLLFAAACIALVGGCWLFNLASDEGQALIDRPSVVATKPSSLAADRYAFLGRFTASERWLGLADSLAARGKTADAANVLVAAVKEHPRDYALWIGLGNMLTDHGGGLNPGARLAYARASEIAPAYPAPRYFLGLAEARSGNVPEARRLWASVLADAPATASWRPLVEDRLAQTAPPPR